MDFELSDGDRMFQRATRALVEKEIMPLVDAAERDQTFPRALFGRLAELGYLCIGYPEKYGGAGATKLQECIYIEEIARASSGIASTILSHMGISTWMIYKFGSEEQRQRYIVPAIKGEKVGAFSLTEPNAGSDVKSIQSRARPDGDWYVLNGQKTMSTNSPFADFITVPAYVVDGDQRRLSIFVVDRNTPGIQIHKLRKMGHHAAETGEVIFDDCRIPKSSLVGEEGKGFEYITANLAGGRVLHGGRSMGLAGAAFDAALKYAQERVQFGRPISQYQAIRFKLADMAVGLDAARLLVYRAACLYDQGKKCMKEASIAKLFASEMAERVAYQSLQIHGGYGYLSEFPIERYFRDSRLYTITEGTSEIQRIIIAKELGI